MLHVWNRSIKLTKATSKLKLSIGYVDVVGTPVIQLFGARVYGWLWWLLTTIIEGLSIWQWFFYLKTYVAYMGTRKQPMKSLALLTICSACYLHLKPGPVLLRLYSLAYFMGAYLEISLSYIWSPAEWRNFRTVFIKETAKVELR